MTKTTTLLAVFYIGLVVGFYAGYEYHKSEVRWIDNHHKAVCDSNPKYQGHMAYDTDGSRMCFQQSKLSGRIERVALGVKGL